MSSPEINGRKIVVLPADLRDDIYISPAQSAILLNVSLATVRRMDWAGRLPFVQISPRRRAIRVGDLKAAASAK